MMQSMKGLTLPAKIHLKNKAWHLQYLDGRKANCRHIATAVTHAGNGAGAHAALATFTTSLRARNDLYAASASAGFNVENHCPLRSLSPTSA